VPLKQQQHAAAWLVICCIKPAQTQQFAHYAVFCCGKLHGYATGQFDTQTRDKHVAQKECICAIKTKEIALFIWYRANCLNFVVVFCRAVSVAIRKQRQHYKYAYIV